MRLYYLFNKFSDIISLPILISSVIFLICEIIGVIFNVFSFGKPEYFNIITNASEAFAGCVLVYFVALKLQIEKRTIKAVFSLLCFVIFYMVLNTKTHGSVSYIFAIIIALIAVYLFRNTNIYIASFTLAVFCTVFSLLLSYVYEYINSLIMSLAELTSGKGIISAVLYIVISLICSLLGIKGYDGCFWYKSYGGAQLINEKIVTGISDLFLSGYRGSLLTDYLSGKYILLFALLGIGLFVTTKLSGDRRIAFLFVLICSVFSGNLSLLLLSLLLLSAHLFFCVITLGVLSSIVGFTLDIRIGMIFNAGLIESLSYINKPVYFVLVCVVITFLGYFTAKYSFEKYSFSCVYQISIPTRLEPTVKALGGLENIIRINDCKIEVRNIKLVNELQCGIIIEDNKVMFENDEITKLLSECL